MKNGLFALGFTLLLGLPVSAGFTDSSGEVTLKPEEAVSLFRKGFLLEKGRKFLWTHPFKWTEPALDAFLERLKASGGLTATRNGDHWDLLVPVAPVKTGCDEEFPLSLTEQVKEMTPGEDPRMEGAVCVEREAKDQVLAGAPGDTVGLIANSMDSGKREIEMAKEEAARLNAHDLAILQDLGIEI